MIRHPRPHRMNLTSSLLDMLHPDVLVAIGLSGSKESRVGAFATIGSLDERLLTTRKKDSHG